MKKILSTLVAGERLSREESRTVMSGISAGKYNGEQIAALLSVYAVRKISGDEMLGFRDALLETALPVDLGTNEYVDIVGTGGDGKNTFNISTLACFVVAGAGYKVAKHGNFGSSSVSGASTVLEYYGAKFTSDINVLRKSLEEANICYLHAPLFNPGMKNVAPVRKSLGIPTFFNIMGPLINPARPKYMVHGVYNEDVMDLYEYVHCKMDSPYALVYGEDGYDEISLTSSSRIVVNGKHERLTPEDLGFTTYGMSSLNAGDTIEHAAQVFMNVLNNKAEDAQTSAVVANAAMAINLLKPELSFSDCVEQAQESLRSGQAKRSFERFLNVYSA